MLFDISMRAEPILKCELGELRDPETHLIPRAMMAIQGHIHDFAVFGSDYPTPDGTAIRDYIHVSDLADAHVAAVRRLLAGGEGGAFNLGTGRGYSVKQVLDAIAAETGERLPISTAPRREGDPPMLVADASQSHRELSFTPRMSDLKTIIKTALAWHRRAHPRLADAKSADKVSPPLSLRSPAAAITHIEPSYSLKGKRVWVAGHRGMVGSALLRRLAQVDYTLLTVAREDLDLTRQAEVEAWMKTTKPQAVFLAAAKVGGIVANNRWPAQFLYDNLAIAANVIHAAEAADVEKLLFLGSS